MMSRQRGRKNPIVARIAVKLPASPKPGDSQKCSILYLNEKHELTWLGRDEPLAWAKKCFTEADSLARPFATNMEGIQMGIV